jgi:bile acid:Na+ symporter, BASS family
MTRQPSRDTSVDGHPAPGSILTRLFPLWALLAGLIGFLAPETLSDWRAAVMPLLGVVMFGMGATLRPADFLAIVRRPALIGLGLGLQFGLMPLIGWTLAQALALPPELLVGMVLVGAAPGGTASNVICYLARGDVALSISLTAASTLLAVALEALKDALQEPAGTHGSARRVSLDALWHYAQRNRVANVMRPYLESLA